MNRLPVKGLFFLIAFIFIVQNTFFGIDFLDGGFIYGLAWRVKNGELPWQDFMYVRPPLSLYLHALFQVIIPENVQVLFERVLFYLMILLHSWLSAVILKRYFADIIDRAGLYLLASLFFIFSAHTFPPIPWHTTDGIILSVSGFYFLSLKDTNKASVVFGMFLLFLAALTKQSFYLIPLGGLVLVFYLKRRTFFTALISLVIYSSAFCLFLFSAGLLDDFLFWTMWAGESSDLLSTGLIAYLDVSFYFLLIPIGIFLFLKIVVPEKIYSLSWVVPALFGFIFLYNIGKAFYMESYIFPPGDYPILLWWISLFTLLWYWKDLGIEQRVIWSFMLLLSWSSSISYGYNIPLLYSVPLIFGPLFLLYKLKEFPIYKVTTFILAGAFSTYFLLNLFTYRDEAKLTVSKHLGNIYPKLTGIFAGTEKYEKLSQVRELVEEYGQDFTILENHPMIHYLEGLKNPLSLDWVKYNEVNEELVIQELKKKKPVVLVDMKPFNERDMEKYKALDYVINNWEQIDSTQYFNVYVSPYSSKELQK